ncbi:hypothetical protein BKA62DRAFT_631981 [Auriculariales sp. MPI-PUGE-AT-0066]|nr:hypothetical protein BKA62DRAFT_631981 [Auriculariales sp. MPI-PUGE-AT-0066]
MSSPSPTAMATPLPTPSVADSATTSSSDAEPGHQCLWENCTRVSPDAETLYAHLCNDHIGRKSTNNLCLTCKWKDCDTTCAKRDHITSHLRVHTPLKPHICEICNKSFKRPQDLKKHEKIHTEEHHQQHKHSKAITVNDPDYSIRVKQQSMGNNGRKVAGKPASSVSSSDRDTPDKMSPLTPSPGFHAIGYDAPPLGLHTWDHMQSNHDSISYPPTGSKRSHESISVEDFLLDVKKRKVAPTYDPHMAERLSNLAFSAGLLNHSHPNLHHSHMHHHMSLQHPPPPPRPSFNPRSVSLDIRTPEELAAVNSFLISLGRDVTVQASAAAAAAAAAHHHQQAPQPSSYFDTAALIRMGLAGLPGIETPAAPGVSNLYNSAYGSSAPSMPKFSPNLTYASLAGPPSHPAQNPNEYGAMYPPLHDLSGAEAALAAIASAAAASNMHHQQMSPSLQSLFAGSYGHVHNTSPTPSHTNSTPPLTHPSPPSCSSTPLSSTPPYAPSLQLYGQPGAAALPENISFDALLRPSGRAPVATLAPLDDVQKDLRPFIRLRSASGLRHEQRPEEEDKDTKMTDGGDDDGEKTPDGNGSAKGLPPSLAKYAFTSKTAPSPSSSLPAPVYPDLKLPSIHSLLAHRESSPPVPDQSPRGRMSSINSDDGSASPTPSVSPAGSPRSDTSVVLPSLASLSVSASASPKPKGTAADDLEQRLRHAEIIRDLLLYINREFASKVGLLPSSPRSPSPSPMEGVEMAMVAVA